MAFKTESELTYDEWRLVHSYRNCRALMRRKKLSRPMRERLPGDLARLEAQAAERGIDPVLLEVWREYPARDGDVSFGLAWGPDGARVQSPRPVKKRRPLPPPSTLDGGALLDAVLAELAWRMKRPGGESS
jgi:hypothetical protein